MTVNEYVLKVRSIADALAAIDAMPDDDDLVSSTLGGLNNEKAWKSFVTSVYVRKPFPDFDELISLMITEEINMQGESSGKSGEQAHAFYSSSRRRRGRFSLRGRGMGRGGDNQQSRLNNQFGDMQISRGHGNSRGRGSSRGRGGWQNRGSTNSGIVCHYCGKTGHIAAQCYAKRDDIRSGKL